jgi:hypothetical protein
MKLLLFYLLIFSTSMYAQPGGITGSTIWLKANAATNTTTHGGAITSWGSNSVTPSPASVTQATALNQPLYQNGAGNTANNRFNYNPFILSDGTNDRLEAIGSFTLGNGSTANGFTVFQVVGFTSGVVSVEWKGPNGMAKLKGDGIYEINDGLGFMGANNQFYHLTQFQAHMASIRGTVAGLTGGRYNSISNTFGSNNQPNSASQRITLFSNIDGGELMAGGYGELIFFPSILNATDNLKVESYLGVKYGITLGDPTNLSNYIATSGTNIWVGNATYQNNIIGIGRDDLSALLQKQSHNYDDTVRIYKGTLATTNIANASTFGSDISYVIVGANTGKMSNTTAANAEVPSPALGSCLLTTRLAREWRITKTNMSELFNMDFKLNSIASIASVNVAHLRLLVDDDGNFANGGTQCFFNGDGTGVVISYAASTITITGISNTHIPNNNTRFITIGSINLTTPLPIELLSFDAKLNTKKTVDLNWITLSERDNDYFTVEKSIDGISWSNNGTLAGTGTTEITQYYHLEDFSPVIGMNYYRLKQTDFNGNSITSETKNIELFPDHEILVFPNPANDKISIMSKNISEHSVQIIDNLGNIVSVDLIVKEQNLIEVNTSHLANGVYYINILDGINPVKKLFIFH